MENSFADPSFAFLRESPWLASKDLVLLGGTHNGYVGIRKDIYDKLFMDKRWIDYATWKGLNLYDYDETLLPTPHGGITFMREVEEEISGMIPITEIPRDYKGSYIIAGFDTGHYGDTPGKWNFETVKDETLRWKSEIDEIIRKKEHVQVNVIDEFNTWMAYRFRRDNHAKYSHLFDEWYTNITEDQRNGFFE